MENKWESKEEDRGWYCETQWDIRKGFQRGEKRIVYKHIIF